jgi:NAD(P)-dependent dehydrogenase (short-subunit alcohol dehydrogenase family)
VNVQFRPVESGEEREKMQLEGRVAIVTGAGRNIGEAIAWAFAEEGARVAVVDLVGERAEHVAASINAAYPNAALAIQTDVTKDSDVSAMVQQVVDRWGGIQVLVNNVGVVDRKPILETEESEWDLVIGISLKSVYLCTRRVAQRMVDAGQGGRIINLASTSGHRPRLDAVAYPAAKAGVLHLTRCLAAQLAPHNIRVNSLTPNRVATEVGAGEVPRSWQIQNLIGRQINPQDVARAAVFLASDNADAITGIDLLVEGGSLQTLASPPRG